MKNFLKIGSLFAVLLFAAVSVQAQKVGYVNTAKILAEMPEVKQAESGLEALQKQLQKQGQAKLEKLQQDYASIQQKVERGELSPVQQQTEAKRLETAQQELATFEQDMMKQLSNKRESSLQPIYDKLNNAIETVAKEGGFSFVLDQAVLLYYDDAADLTAKVKAKLGL